jgi:hypothetical protein
MRVYTWHGITVLAGFRHPALAIVDGLLRCVIRPRMGWLS